MAVQILSVVELTADNVEDVLAVAPSSEQLRHVNPVAWYVPRSAYQQVWHSVGLATARRVSLASPSGPMTAPTGPTTSVGSSSTTSTRVWSGSCGAGCTRRASSSAIGAGRYRAHRARGTRMCAGAHERYGFAATGDVIEGELVMVLRQDD